MSVQTICLHPIACNNSFQWPNWWPFAIKKILLPVFMDRGSLLVYFNQHHNHINTLTLWETEILRSVTFYSIFRRKGRINSRCRVPSLLWHRRGVMDSWWRLLGRGRGARLWRLWIMSADSSRLTRSHSSSNKNTPFPSGESSLPPQMLGFPLLGGQIGSKFVTLAVCQARQKVASFIFIIARLGTCS